MLRVDSVSSLYGNAQVLFDISFEIPENSVFSIIGPNGAGKTTLLDCITGFKSYNGEISVDGKDVSKYEPWDIADTLGYCTEENNLFGDLTIEQNLLLSASGKKNGSGTDMEHVYELFPRLRERTDQKARTLSGGESKMLAIARALVRDPEILILDEPSLGLAPSVLADIDDVLDQIAEQGRTVLVAEQNVTFGMEHADNIMILESGEQKLHSHISDIEEDEKIWETYMGQ
jgi:branched-chain amino acid transport system ATP-binding protein